MTYINQKHEFDCLQATLSNLLDIYYHAIPEFHKNYKKYRDNNKFLAEYDEWLGSIGMYRLLFDVSIDDCGCIKIPICFSADQIKAIGIFEKSKYQAHAMLITLNRSGKKIELKILHDPKIDSGYELSDITQVEIILRIV